MLSLFCFAYHAKLSTVFSDALVLVGFSQEIFPMFNFNTYHVRYMYLWYKLLTIGFDFYLSNLFTLLAVWQQSKLIMLVNFEIGENKTKQLLAVFWVFWLNEESPNLLCGRGRRRDYSKLE